MDWRERIEANPDVLVGKPVVKGTRMAVEFIIGLMAQGWSEEQILQNYRHLTREDIRACLAYAGELLQAEGSIRSEPSRCRSWPTRTCRRP